MMSATTGVSGAGWINTSRHSASTLSTERGQQSQAEIRAEHLAFLTSLRQNFVIQGSANGLDQEEAASFFDQQVSLAMERLEANENQEDVMKTFFDALEEKFADPKEKRYVSLIKAFASADNDRRGRKASPYDLGQELHMQHTQHAEALHSFIHAVREYDSDNLAKMLDTLQATGTHHSQNAISESQLWDLNIYRYKATV